MTALTFEALEEAIRSLMDQPEDKIAVRPTKLIVSAQMNRQLFLRPPVRKVRGPQGRMRALKRRRVSLLTRLFFYGGTE